MPPGRPVLRSETIPAILRIPFIPQARIYDRPVSLISCTTSGIHLKRLRVDGLTLWVSLTSQSYFLRIRASPQAGWDTLAQKNSAVIGDARETAQVTAE